MKNTRSRFIILFITLIIPSLSFALVFIDDFDDGDLLGWTIKSGDWTNPGDHLLSSYNNYGVIWKDDSFGYNQSIKVDAYFDDANRSKTAQLRLRSGDAGSGPNPYWDHGYLASISSSLNGATYVAIINTVQPYHQVILAEDWPTTQLAGNRWHSLEFSVSGVGYDTHLELWIDGELFLETNDTSGYAHDDGGYLALGSSNHINRRISYDNAEGYTQNPLVHDVTVLENTVASLNLPNALENSYDANLKKVGILIETEKLKPAVNNLQAFIHKVEQDIAKGKIPAADGEALITMATEIIHQLSL